jgi:tartrate dehydrogenase/decarboxylase/D-malate dehydrogenase
MDVVIVRENTEGEYSSIGGRHRKGRPDEFAVQQSVVTRAGTARIAAYAARLAEKRQGVLVSATKSNGIIHSMPFWDQVVAETVSDVAPEVRLESALIDALAARLVSRPDSLDVIVASNLFGDILSDVAAAVAGSIGVAPSANLDPERRSPSLFEPVHGSAPDIAGLGVANPVGALWAAAMMLDHLELPDMATELEGAFRAVLADGVATRDLGGSASTAEFSAAVFKRLEGNAD